MTKEWQNYKNKIVKLAIGVPCELALLNVFLLD